MTKKQIIGRWTAVLLWAGFIFFMSSRDATQLGEGVFDEVSRMLATFLNDIFGYHDDPVSPFAHFCEYTILSLLVIHAFHASIPHLPKAIACSTAGIGLYALSDEIHQLFVPGRFCDPADWMVDLSGALFGAVIFCCASYLYHRYRSHKKISV